MHARQAALALLDAVLREHRMLAQVRVPASGAEAARAGRLAATVLRNLGQADAVLRPYLDRKPQLPVQNLLRLGTVELLAEGEDAHGVTHDLVQIAKARAGTRRAAGMINAVLRKVATEGPAAWAALKPQRLPGWIAKPLLKRMDTDTLRTIERVHRATPPIDLTPRDADVEIPDATRLPTGSWRLSESAQISAMPGYDSGAFWVQDAAAALPVRLLGDVSGKRVLDLCAAPGGKTMQLAAAGANVTALDVSPARMKRVSENLARTGLAAKLVIEDAFAHTERYDAILLDAPCTASGTIRRHPDLPFLKSGKDVEPLTRLQMRLLDHALSLLEPGGLLVFCTCSLLPVEGEFQITAALKRHEGLRVIPADAAALGGEAAWQSAEGGLRLHPAFWPEIGGMDGFYMAALTTA